MDDRTKRDNWADMVDEDLDEEENTFSGKVRSYSESTFAVDYDPDSNDELDYDPDNNDELHQTEKTLYCHQCATETTKTFQFLKRENGTWICKACLEEMDGTPISTKQWKTKPVQLLGLR